jgi:DNA mismatch endonuclease (patch repair protein)
MMSLIRGAGNKGTELRLVQIFRANGIIGWRRQQRIRFNIQRPTSNPERSKFDVGSSMFSRGVRPDFVFRRLRVAVFVDGCFWHGCPRHFIKPKGNAKFWRDKIATNRARDRKVNRTLRSMGWKVARVWEHELKRRDEPQLVRRLMRILGRSA